MTEPCHVFEGTPSAAHHCYTREHAVTIDLPTDVAHLLNQVRNSRGKLKLYITAMNVEVGAA